MPFGKTLSDFYTEQMDREQTRKNDRWTKLMQALGLAKDVWGKFQERAWELEDVTPGSKKYELAKQQAYGWPMELATTERGWRLKESQQKNLDDFALLSRQDQLATKRIELEDQLAEARNQNDFARQKELDMELSKLDDARAKLNRESAERIAGVSKDEKAAKRQADLRSAIIDYVAQLPAARPDFVVLDENGQSTLDLSRTDELKAIVIKAFSPPGTPQEDIDFITSFLDTLWAVKSGKGQGGKLAAGEIAPTPFDFNKLTTALQTAQAVAGTAQKAVGPTGKAPGLPRFAEHKDFEANIESAVDELIKDETVTDTGVDAELEGYKKQLQGVALLSPEQLLAIFKRIQEIYNTYYSRGKQALKAFQATPEAAFTPAEEPRFKFKPGR